MRAIIITCDMCGDNDSKLVPFDILETTISRNDGSQHKLDLCNACFRDLMKVVKDKKKRNK